MASVIERHGYSLDDDGSIIYDDRRTTIKRAESLAGKRLDRRCSYAIVHGEVCRSVSFTQPCSGCYQYGCEECGYRGKVRQSHWLPLMAFESQDTASS